MKLSCQDCGKEIILPDSKIPAGRSFSVKCPSCGAKIPCKGIDRPVSRNNKEDPSAQGREGMGKEPSQREPMAKKQEISLDDVGVPESMEDYLEDYEGDELRALVCDIENREAIEKALKEMGYRMSVPENISTALNKMKFNKYHLIIINEDFDGFSLKENPVLHYIQPMPMAERRYLFVALLGKSFKTRDPLNAYALSVDLIINLKDLGHLTRLLKNAMQENEGLYKIFKEALAAIGKV